MEKPNYVATYNDHLARYPDVKLAIAQGHFRSGLHHFDVCGASEGRR
jgi:hypothetical protein